MKKKLLKRLTTVVVAVAMVATMVTGFSVDVKAADPYVPKSDAERDLISLVDENSENLISSDVGTLKAVLSQPFVGASGNLLGALDFFNGKGYSISFNNNTWTITTPGDPLTISVSVVSGNYIEKVEFNNGGAYTWIFINSKPAPTPDPTPTPEPKKAETVEKEKPAKEVDRDTFKSEAPYGTAGITNSNSKVGDLKVHKVNAITETNQKFLADAFSKQHGKRARILTTVSLHPRRELGVDNGKKESLIYSNLEKNPQTVYAVCYNQTDKAYYLTGTLDKDGVATFPGFILRDATNITIFVLE